MAEPTEATSFVPLRGRLAARFRQVRRLGEGGQGSVVLALDLETDEEVALKVLALRGEQASVERFLREARVMAQFVHPNLARFLELHAEHRPPVLVMEAIPGRSLDRQLRAEGPLDADQLRSLGRDLAAALELIHAKGCLHRDIKPANVVLHPERGPVLVDLGCAFVHGSGELTRTGVVLGTPAYLAPELLAGQPATPASDVFSLGVLLSELSRGERPFEVDDLLSAAAGEGLAADPADDLREKLGPLAAGCLALRPERRPSAAELVSAWKDPSRPLPLTRASSEGASTMVVPTHRPGRALALGAVGLALVGLAGWSLVGGPAPEPRRARDPVEGPGVGAEKEVARLRDAARRLAAYHQDASGRLAPIEQPYRVARERLEANLERALEPTYPLKVRRLLEALVGWVEAAGPAADGPEGRVLLAQEVGPVAAVAARDLDVLRTICDPSFYSVEYSLDPRTARRRERHQGLVESLRAMIQEVVTTRERLPGPVPAGAEVALAKLAEAVGVAAAEAALERLEERPDAGGFRRELEAFLMMRPCMRGMRLTGVGCPTRYRILERMVRRRAATDGDRLVRLTSHLATWWWCRDAPDEDGLAVVDTDLEALRGAPDFPALPRTRAVEFWEVADVYWAVMEDAGAISPRLRQLGDRLGITLEERQRRRGPPRSPLAAPPGAPAPAGRRDGS